MKRWLVHYRIDDEVALDMGRVHCTTDQAPHETGDRIFTYACFVSGPLMLLHDATVVPTSEPVDCLACMSKEL